jgi:hypothetical protein
MAPAEVSWSCQPVSLAGVQQISHTSTSVSVVEHGRSAVADGVRGVHVATRKVRGSVGPAR